VCGASALLYAGQLSKLHYLFMSEMQVKWFLMGEFFRSAYGDVERKNPYVSLCQCSLVKEKMKLPKIVR
jgi:hypothetical protein